MEHQDWADWPEDDPYLDNADTADLSDPDGDLADLGVAGGHDPFGAEPGGVPAGGENLFEVEPGGPGGGDPLESGDLALGGDVYPEDDPFGAEPGQEAETVVRPDTAAEPTDDQPAGEERVVEQLVGADPDVDPRADDAGWDDDPFPPSLDLADAPEPVDGYPWSDPATLGSGVVDDPGRVAESWPSPPVGELFDYAGLEQPGDGDAWQTLLGSDDPATSTLARWWSPGA